MKENLLHFVWKLQLFSSEKIECTNGENISIITKGLQNFNSGPDFLNAKIEINGQLWAGNIEIHVNASDWYLHNHEIDENYDTVILHVVWDHDVEVFRKTNSTIPTLELQNYISQDLLKKYDALFSKNKKWINCENTISLTNNFTLLHWLERLYVERLEHKSNQIQKVLKSTNNNWEATLFIMLAKNFGLKINSDSFLNFANSFDFSILRKVSSNLIQLEALFFGQAGLLSNNCESNYYDILRKEYAYLKVKFNLTPISIGQVQFFRLRPNNFPTIRLSQLALLYHNYPNLFSKIIEKQSINEYYELLNISTSPFWESHYTFEKESKKSIKKLTKSFIDLLLINTLIPMKFLYLKSLGKNDFSEVIDIIEAIKPEKNGIISKFNEIKVKSKSAFDTQALIQLKNEYCNKQNCLVCEIGKDLLGK